MNINAEILSLKYKYAVEKLLSDIGQASKLEEIRNIFYDFIKIYTALPCIWLEWIRREQLPHYPDYNRSDVKLRLRKIKQLASKYFLSKKYAVIDKHSLETGIFERSLYFPWSSYQHIALTKCELPGFTTTGLESALIFPHGELKNVMEFCKKWSARPLPLAIQKGYTGASILYQRIADCLHDDEKWLAALLETQDDGYIIASIEYRLGDEPLNTRLWKLYIRYLNDTNPMAMLDVYQRYCRLFIDDLAMRRRYWRHVEILGGFKKDVTKWWLDCIEFERTFVCAASSFLFLKKILSSQTIHPELFLQYLFWFENLFPNRTCFQNLKEQFPSPKTQLQYSILPDNRRCLKSAKRKLTKPSAPKPLTMRIQESEGSPQNLSLPSTMIHYLFQNCSPELHQRLNQSCKNFFLLKPIPLCHKLTIMDLEAPKYIQQSLYLSPETISSHLPASLKITNTLYINCSIDPKIFSTISPRVSFGLRHLHLVNQELSTSELGRLDCSRIKSIELQNVTVIAENGTPLPLEDIIERFPSASNINLCSNEFTPQSAQKLANLHRRSKLGYFKLSNIPETFKPKAFAQFIMKNYTSETKSVIVFDSSIDINYKLNFEKTVKKAIKCWKNAG